MYELIRNGRCVCRSCDRAYLEKIMRCQRTMDRQAVFQIKTIN